MSTKKVGGWHEVSRSEMGRTFNPVGYY